MTVSHAPARRLKRRRRVRAKVRGSAERPRLSVFRSNRGIGAQLRIVPLQRRILGPQDESRVPAPVPIRYGRMLASPFAFPREARSRCGWCGRSRTPLRQRPGCRTNPLRARAAGARQRSPKPRSPRDGATALQVGVGVAAIRAETPAKDDP